MSIARDNNLIRSIGQHHTPPLDAIPPSGVQEAQGHLRGVLAAERRPEDAGKDLPGSQTGAPRQAQRRGMDGWRSVADARSGRGGGEFVLFQYWVDPNAGDPKDAILVYCDMATAETATCIQPKPDMSDVTTVEGIHESMRFSCTSLSLQMTRKLYAAIPIHQKIMRAKRQWSQR